MAGTTLRWRRSTLFGSKVNGYVFGKSIYKQWLTFGVLFYPTRTPRFYRCFRPQRPKKMQTPGFFLDPMAWGR
jgi:hypothetical protein